MNLPIKFFITLVVIIISGCQSDGSVLESNVAAHWGREESNSLQALVCRDVGGFSLKFESSGLNIPVAFSRRRLCGLPRPYTEPSNYLIYGDLKAILYNQSGEILVECKLSATHPDNIFDLKTLECSDDVDSKFRKSKLAPAVLELNLINYLDNFDHVIVDNLEMDINGSDRNSVFRLVVPTGIFFVDKTIVLNRDVEIVGVSADLSVLKAANENVQEIIRVEPKEEYLLVLPSETEAGVEQLPLGENTFFSICKKVVIRDESKLWPFDERASVFYGELNEISSVEEGQVNLIEPTRSSYSEGSSISVFCPVSVSISHISLVFEKQTLKTKALSIRGAEPLLISNVKTENSGWVGIWVAESSNVSVVNSILKDGYPNDCRACYGIQTYGSQDVMIKDNEVFNFRRGVDISGYFPSRRVIVQNNYVIANSDTSVAASGIGTHGSAVGVIFRNNRTEGGIVSILTRGNDILITNNSFLNPEYSAVYLDSGAVNYVRDNELGGVRMNNSLTLRGIEFHIKYKHLYSEILRNSVTAKTGVRVSDTPNRLRVEDNFLVDGESFITIDDGLELEHLTEVEFDWFK